MQKSKRWIDLANQLKSKVYVDDTTVIVEGVKQAQQKGVKVVIIACSRNHRDSLYTKLRLAGVRPQTAVVITINDVVSGRLKAYKSRPLIIPRWTWTRIVGEVINNPDDSIDPRDGKFTRF